MASRDFILKLKKAQFYQHFSTQNSDLDNEQLDEIGQKAKAKNTKRTTEWVVKEFEKWCEKGKITEGLKAVSLIQRT